ncbi:unknown protein [Seminavis robusta]|uniref:Uncharacterized protein n=1 Tax=Seminavis robusta TaxID=568900 RepID=A0A9N8EA01_9STRA|nr:unknown protein [Seminavis robusta]|eukprot:Sro712_g191300.1 n/a (609) ;mRNA; r:5207-7377
MEGTPRRSKRSSTASLPPRTPTNQSSKKESSKASTGRKGPRTRSKGGETSDADSQASRASAGSRGSGSTGTRTRLPLWIEKQLAEDIESEGGILGFDANKAQGLSELCDYRTEDLNQPEFYGTRGSDQRRKISQKVTRWKKADPAKYLERLAVLGVTPSKLRKGKNKGSRKKGLVPQHKKKDRVPETIEAKTVDDDISLDDLSQDLSLLSIEEEVEPSIKEPAARKQEESKKPPTNDSTPKSRNKSKKSTPLKTTAAKKQIKMSNSFGSDVTRTIHIDLSSPGDQGEGVFVFKISAFEHVLPAGFRLDATEYGARQANVQIKTGHKAALTAYGRLPPQDVYQKFCLQFSDNVKLTEAPFGVTGSAGEQVDTAAMKVILYRKGTGKKDKSNQDVLDLHTRITFVFADLAKKTVLDGATKRGSKAVDDAFGGNSLFPAAPTGILVAPVLMAPVPVPAPQLLPAAAPAPAASMGLLSQAVSMAGSLVGRTGKKTESEDIEATQKAMFKKTADSENRMTVSEKGRVSARKQALAKARSEQDGTEQMIDTLMEEFDGDVAERRALGLVEELSSSDQQDVSALPPLPDDVDADLDGLFSSESEDEYLDYDDDGV